MVAQNHLYPLSTCQGLVHCPIRKNKRRKNLRKFCVLFWRSPLEHGRAAEWISLKAAGFRTPWHVGTALNCLGLGNSEIFRGKRRKHENKNGRFLGLGSLINIILTLFWPDGLRSEWMVKFCEAISPWDSYMLLVHLVDRHGGKTSVEAVWGCF